MTSSEESRNKPKSGRLLMIALFAAVIVAFIVSGGFVLAKQQLIQRQTTQLSQNAALGPHVLVTQISGGSASRTIELPATIHGYIENPVYAKVAGYIKTINVDKGDHVKAGEVIALIESPETDKMVADARSFYWIQNVTDVRYQELVRQQVVPQQTADQSHSAMLQAQAAYQRTIATEPNYAPAYLNLGILYDLYLAEPQKALEQFEHYMQIAGENKQVAGWVVELRKRVGAAAPAAKKEPS